MSQINEKLKQFINSYPGEVKYRWPEPLKEKQLADIEQALGYSLPPAYRAFLRDYGNTVYVPMSTMFPMPKREEAHNDVISILGFYGVVSKGIFAPSIVERYREKSDIVPQEWLPITGEDNKDIFLSLAGDDAGAVYFLDGFGGTEPTKDDIYFLANSFDEFLEQLEPYSLE